jgi:hypothetical protein
MPGKGNRGRNIFSDTALLPAEIASKNACILLQKGGNLSRAQSLTRFGRSIFSVTLLAS